MTKEEITKLMNSYFEDSKFLDNEYITEHIHGLIECDFLDLHGLDYKTICDLGLQDSLNELISKAIGNM